MLIDLDSLTAYPEFLRDYTQLKDVNLRRSLEAEQGLFMAESNEVIGRALRAGYTPRSLLLAPHWLENIRPLLAASPATGFADDGGPIPVFVAPEALLERLVGFHLHRGAIAAMQR